MSIKIAQKWFHWKNGRFWYVYKNCLKCVRFGQINCCHRLWKVAQSSHTEEESNRANDTRSQHQNPKTIIISYHWDWYFTQSSFHTSETVPLMVVLLPTCKSFVWPTPPWSTSTAVTTATTTTAKVFFFLFARHSILFVHFLGWERNDLWTTPFHSKVISRLKDLFWLFSKVRFREFDFGQWWPKSC